MKHHDLVIHPLLSLSPPAPKQLPIIEYLDETRPEPPLLPRDDAKKRFQIRRLAEIVNAGIQPVQVRATPSSIPASLHPCIHPPIIRLFFICPFMSCLPVEPARTEEARH